MKKNLFTTIMFATAILGVTSLPLYASDENTQNNQPTSSDAILVTLDQATILRLDAPAKAIIIGNPSIADAIVQDGKTLIVTGKGYGNTNMIGLDSDGNQLFERQLVVRVPEAGRITVYNGNQRSTLACAPKCQPSVTLGDDNSFFSGSAGQIQSRNSFSGQ